MARVISRKREREKRIRLRVAASLMNALGVAGSALVALLCLLLLRSLSQWISGDFQATFSVLEASVWNAVMVGFR